MLTQAAAALDWPVGSPEAMAEQIAEVTRLPNVRVVVIPTRTPVFAHQALFTELETLAVYDDEARTLLAQVAEEYRAMG